MASLDPTTLYCVFGAMWWHWWGTVLLKNEKSLLDAARMSAIGGSRGWPDGPVPRLWTLVPRLCPGRQAVVISFCYGASVFRVSLYHISHKQVPTLWCLWYQKAGFSMQIFDNFLGLTFRISLREGLYPIPLQHDLRPGAGRKYFIAVTQTIVPPQKLWRPTCSTARTNSWRRHWCR